jgi:serine/threonine protein kinase
VEPAPEPPVLDGYEYQETLGSGGFADVYRYKQRFPRRSVAVKVLRATTVDRAARHQFIAEANTMAQLSNHPAIATNYSAGVTGDDRPYLVMEYCSRGSLATTYRLNPLPVDQVLRIGVRIASALESAHRLGIVHRDVKPANLLITDYGAAVLSDFGISTGGTQLAEVTMLRTERTSISTLSGDSTTLGLSVPWAPPEALDDEPTIDARSDVYSLGATLFTLLEGRSPFENPGGSNGALHLSRRIERGALVPGERVDRVPELSALLRRALSVEPADRPQTALAFAEQLGTVERALGHEPTPIELLGDGLPPADAAPLAESTVLRARAEIDNVTRPRRSARTGEATTNKPAEERPRRRLAFIIGAAALVVALGGAAIASAFAASNAHPEAAPTTSKPTVHRTQTPTPDPSPAPAIPVADVEIPPLCAQKYYDEQDAFFADADYTVSYAPITELFEPLALSTGASPVCGHDTRISGDPNASQEFFVAGGQDDLEAIVDALSGSYTCVERNDPNDLDCSSGKHHVNVSYAYDGGSALGTDAIFLWLWGGEYCGDEPWNCTTSEGW